MAFIGYEVIKGETQSAEKVGVLGLFQTKGNMDRSGLPGRIALYGDSNCLDNSHLQKGQ